MKKIITVIACLMVVAAVGILSKNYYESTYVGSTFYVLVPQNQEVSLVPLYSMKGEEVGIGGDYEFTAYNEEGEPRTVSFSIHTENEEDLLRGGTYLKMEASEKRVLSWQRVREEEVPNGAKVYLQDLFQN